MTSSEDFSFVSFFWMENKIFIRTRLDLAVMGLAGLIVMAALSVPATVRDVSQDEAKKIVKDAMKEVTIEYPRIEREFNHVEIEFKLFHKGMPIGDVERRYRDVTRPDSDYAYAFKKELQELLPSAKITYCRYDREDKEWEVSIYLASHIDMDEIKVDSVSGNLIPD